jgi:hypothetical protein
VYASMVEDSKKGTKSAARSGEATTVELLLDRYVGNAIHLFLTVLAIAILIAAVIAAFDIVVRDFPQLWRQGNEYDVLHQVIQNILLVAIAGELGLLLLFHRASAAIEVIIFVVARKMVTPGISGVELLLGTAALAGLVIVRFYFLRGPNKSA